MTRCSNHKRHLVQDDGACSLPSLAPFVSVVNFLASVAIAGYLRTA